MGSINNLLKLRRTPVKSTIQRKTTMSWGVFNGSLVESLGIPRGKIKGGLHLSLYMALLWLWLEVIFI